MEKWVNDLQESFDKLNVIIDGIFSTEDLVRLLMNTALGMSTSRGGLFMRLVNGCWVYGIGPEDVKNTFDTVINRLTHWIEFATGERACVLTHSWEFLDPVSVIIVEK